MGSIAWGNALQMAGQGLSQWAQFRDQQQNRDEALRQRNNELGLRQMEIDRQAMMDALQEDRVRGAQRYTQGMQLATNFGGQIAPPAVADELQSDPMTAAFIHTPETAKLPGALGMIPAQAEGAAMGDRTFAMPQSEKFRIAELNAAQRAEAARVAAGSRVKAAEVSAKQRMDAAGITDSRMRYAIDSQLQIARMRIAQARDEMELDEAMNAYNQEVDMWIAQARGSRPDPFAGLAGLITGQGAAGAARTPGAPPAAPPSAPSPNTPPKPVYPGGKRLGAAADPLGILK